MKEQYLAQIQNGYCSEGEWWNAKMMQTTEGGRYCKTLEEAQQWIREAVGKGQQAATSKTHIGTPPFSMESKPDERNLIRATRIRKRMVSEWEEVE